MHDGATDALQGLKGGGRSACSRAWGQHLYGSTSGGNVGVCSIRARTRKFEIRSATSRERKPTSISLEAHAHQRLKEAQLACHAHGLGQGLIPRVAQIHAAPDGAVVQGLGRPGRGQADRTDGRRRVLASRRMSWSISRPASAGDGHGSFADTKKPPPASAGGRVSRFVVLRLTSGLSALLSSSPEEKQGSRKQHGQRQLCAAAVQSSRTNGPGAATNTASIR